MDIKMMLKQRLSHKQDSVAYDRPDYRAGRRERAVKVYTINDESRYLLVQNVPQYNASKELLELFALYGEIEEYRILDEFEVEPYTEVYWIRMKQLSAARLAKRKIDDYQFFGNSLHISYAPEYESIQDLRQKMKERRSTVARKTRAGDYYISPKDITVTDTTKEVKTDISQSKPITSTEPTTINDPKPIQEAKSYPPNWVPPVVPPTNPHPTYYSQLPPYQGIRPPPPWNNPGAMRPMPPNFHNGVRPPHYPCPPYGPPSIPPQGPPCPPPIGWRGYPSAQTTGYYYGLLPTAPSMSSSGTSSNNMSGIPPPPPSYPLPYTAERTSIGLSGKRPSEGYGTANGTATDSKRKERRRI